MKTHRFSAVLAGIILGSWLVAAAQEAAAPSPRQVEIRARVSSADRFLDDLTLADFSILEDGRPQALRSLALVRGGSVLRSEGIEKPAARLERSYALLFQAVDWDPRLSEAVAYLFGSVLNPGDSMTLVTPMKPYHLQKDALARKSKAELSKGMEDVLRKDILRGGGEYRDLLSDLRRLIKAIAGSTSTSQEDIDSDPTMEAASGFGLEMQIDRYRQALMKLEGIRLVDGAKLLSFAGSLKAVPGQKTVILFYQREYRPEISPATMNQLMVLYQDNPEIQGSLMDLFTFYKREETFDADRVKKAFADAGIDFHFIFMEKKSQRIFGATMREQSEDTFPGFVEIARATGGTTASTSNPAAAFKRAADASGEYYVISYVPERSALEGGFRTIDVRVKRPSSLVTSPLGYYAR